MDGLYIKKLKQTIQILRQIFSEKNQKITIVWNDGTEDDCLWADVDWNMPIIPIKWKPLEFNNVSFWSNETPNKPGYYWFYGDPFSSNPRPQDITVYLVKFKQNSNNHLFFICDGHFMDNKIGQWMPAELPEIPS